LVEAEPCIFLFEPHNTPILGVARQQLRLATLQIAGGTTTNVILESEAFDICGKMLDTTGDRSDLSKSLFSKTGFTSYFAPSCEQAKSVLMPLGVRLLVARASNGFGGAS
jgi:hypothetical protein